MSQEPVTPNSISRVCVDHPVDDWVSEEEGGDWGRNAALASSRMSTDLANPGKPKARGDLIEDSTRKQ